MKRCPDCGKEYTDDKEFCAECGIELEENIEQPRTTVTENLRFVFKLAGSNYKIYYPYIAMFIGSIVMVIVVFILGFGFMGFEGTSGPTYTNGITLFFIIFGLIGFYFGIISTPLLQHVYKTAVEGAETKLRESFKYASARRLIK